MVLFGLTFHRDRSIDTLHIHHDRRATMEVAEDVVRTADVVEASCV
jgi:hypothetical protein